MSEQVNEPEVVASPPLTEEQIRTSEKERLLVLLLKNSREMVSEYKVLVKHTGGLLAQSMAYAYSKGINDATKLIAKETK
jgi:hypothetical protein